MKKTRGDGDDGVGHALAALMGDGLEEAHRMIWDALRPDQRTRYDLVVGRRARLRDPSGERGPR